MAGVQFGSIHGGDYENTTKMSQTSIVDGHIQIIHPVS